MIKCLVILFLFSYSNFLRSQEIDHSTLFLTNAQKDHYKQLAQVANGLILAGKTKGYHNLFISRYYLKAPIDSTISSLKFLIKYHPVYACEFFFRPRANFPVFSSQMNKNAYGNKIINEIEPICDSVFELMDSVIIEILKVVEVADQKYRNSNYDSNVGKFTEILKIRDSIDRLNVQIVESIIKYRGYPGKEMVGSNLEHVAWAVLQHSDVKTLEKYLPMIKNACDTEQLFLLAYPYSVDRYCVWNNVPQQYGTQEFFNRKSKKMEIWAVDNVEKVNERRKQYGWGTLQEKILDKGMKLQTKE